MSDSGTPIKVPISTTVTNLGTVVYNNQDCTKFQVQVASTNNSANSVGFTPPSGVYVDPAAVDVPASGSVNTYVYVPTSNNGAVSVTASETGYSNRDVTVRS
jgi:hypothetical protein